MSEILEIAQKAKKASRIVAKLKTEQKNKILYAVAKALWDRKDEIIANNKIDVGNAKKDGLSEALIDRLRLDDSRIKSMIDSVTTLASFTDPIGIVTEGYRHKNGMSISKVRVPLGVIAMIYESRPNVSIDAAALALKSSNAIILKGSKNALNSNKILCQIFNDAAKEFGLCDGAVCLIENMQQQSIIELVRLDKFIDVLIPRGGLGLKKFINENATIPVIQTGAGVCHIFVDKSADLTQALEIIKNAKTQRPSTCNSVECILLHKDIVDKFFSMQKLDDVELRLEDKLYQKYHANGKNIVLADDSDFGAEFLSMKLAVKEVSDVSEAIEYINSHSTSHSDSILSLEYENIEKFLNEVDSAVVYANASTRFSDGGEFGFGGEIGISTQKLHARGPMGVLALTSEKFIVRGSGQVRK